MLITVTVTLLLLLLSFASALPNGTETIVTTDTAGLTDSTPALSGDSVVCLENMNSLVMYNLVTGETVTLPLTDPGTYFPAQPAISGNTVAWQEYDMSGYARIVRYDISGGTIQDYFDAAQEPWGEYAIPKTDGTTLVWQNYNTTNYDWDVAVVRDGSTEPELILCSTNNEKHPSVYGDSVVYENWTDSDHSSIWRYNLADDTSEIVSSSADQEINPQIQGDRIVWQARNADETEWHVDIWENGGLTQLTPPGTDQRNPSLDGNRVAVEDYRRLGSVPDVYVYEYTAPSWREIWVAPNSYDAAQMTPAVSNNRVVWEDTRSGTACGGCDSDVYMVTLGTSDTCPVAAFTPSENAGPDPLTVTFADHSSGSPILYRIWTYSDGTTRYPLDPSGQIFSGPGIYHTALTVGNAKCRNVTPSVPQYDIYVDTPPDADFTASPLWGFAPLTVQFTDTSGGSPATWTWDFGDGSVSHAQNPVHVFTTPGKTCTVSLTVNNTFAAMAPDTETKTEYIRTFLGATGMATTPVAGITVNHGPVGWSLAYDAAMLPDMARPNPRVLIAFHPDSAGWQNITFLSNDPRGFSEIAVNHLYLGSLSEVIFQTDDLTVSETSPSIGTGWGISYRFENTTVPSPATVRSEIWESTTATDRSMFRSAIIGANFIENPDGIAYTARVTKEGITADGTATINMSVSRSWIGGREAHTYVAGYGINSQGDTIGGVRPARFLFDDGTLDYFEAEVPGYFTTFGITPLSGSGNPFQLVTLSIASHISPSTDEGSSQPGANSGTAGGGRGKAGTGTAPVVTAAATGTPVPVPTEDPGTTARIYTNGAGEVTQATRLASTDGRAVVSISEGVVARDKESKPLTGMTIRALLPADVPQVAAGSPYTFAGIAYDIGPDDATFSPPVTLTLTLPQAAWGKDYSAKAFDRMSGTWQDRPSFFDAATGTLTVQVSHLCVFAVFSEPTAPSVTTTAKPPVTAAPGPQETVKPPATAVSIFMSMLEWAGRVVADNLIIVLIVIVIAVTAVLLYRQRRSGGG